MTTWPTPQVQDVVAALTTLPVDRAPVVRSCVDPPLPGVAIFAEPLSRLFEAHAFAVIHHDDRLHCLKFGELEVDVDVVRPYVQRIPDGLGQCLRGSLAQVRQHALAHLHGPGRHTGSHTTSARRHDPGHVPVARWAPASCCLTARPRPSSETFSLSDWPPTAAPHTPPRMTSGSKTSATSVCS
jgi:hypothetical protein